MKSIELNDTNWFARYHKFIYGSLPDNFCAFFWKLLSAIIFFPLVLPSEIQNNYFNSERSDRSFVVKIILSLLIYFVMFLLTGLGGSCLEEIWGNETVHGWNLGGWLLLLSLVVGIFLAVGVLLTVGFTLAGCVYLHDTIKERKRNKKNALNGKLASTGPTQLKLMIDNIRSKYCTKIVWKSKDAELEIE